MVLYTYIPNMEMCLCGLLMRLYPIELRLYWYYARYALAYFLTWVWLAPLYNFSLNRIVILALHVIIGIGPGS